MTISGKCFAIFYKTEVQMVIFWCLTSLNLNWFKGYGLRCSLRPGWSLANILFIGGSGIYFEVLKES